MIKMLDILKYILFGSQTGEINATFSYIDPGTGSMLFTIVIGLISTAIYSLKGLLIKFKTRDKSSSKNTDVDHHKFVIFSDSKRYWNVFEEICREFERRSIDLLYLTMSEDDPVLELNCEHIKGKYIGNGNGAFAALNYLDADIVLSTTPGLDVYQWKRSNKVKYYVHIPHMINDITTYRMFGLDYYDAILCVNDIQANQVREIEKLRGISNKELLTVGCTYFDRMLQDVGKLKKEKNKETTVLLAPSWGESAILKKYGSKMIDALISTGYKIIVRPHPQSFTAEKEMLDELMKKYPQIEWNRDNNNLEVLNRSVILISDFSGVIFDYTLIFDKPVIYTDTKFDKSPYDAWWIEDDLWTFKVLPELGVQLNEDNMSDIKKLIDGCLSDNRFKEGRKKIREIAWPNVSGSAKKTVDYLISKEEEICK